MRNGRASTKGQTLRGKQKAKAMKKKNVKRSKHNHPAPQRRDALGLGGDEIGLEPLPKR